MSKSKIVAMMVLIAFAIGILLVGDVVAGEKGKIIARQACSATTVHTLKVPDVENHAISLIEGKGIAFNEKWGAHLIYLTYTMDLIKGESTVQGYTQYTFPDGSTYTSKWEGKNMGAGRGIAGSPSSEGTWTFIKGTGRFEGIQGEGTYVSYILVPGQWYSDIEGQYTLP